MNTLRLAWRGLLRNRRRSLVTLLAIALGFAAITLFAGYTKNVYEGLAQQAIHAGLLGHLTLNKRGMTREGKLDPGRYLFNAAEIARIKSLLDDEPHIELIAPRLTLSGLASNSRVSTIFIARTLFGSVASGSAQPSTIGSMSICSFSNAARLLVATKIWKIINPIKAKIHFICFGSARLVFDMR